MERKVVIVTGGSRGIGKEIVECLAKSGFYVILNYKSSEEEAIKIKEKLSVEGNIIEIFKADVSKEDEVKDLIKFTLYKFKELMY